MRLGAIAGFLLIIIGVGLFAYYDHFIKTEDDARKLLTEGVSILEGGNKEAVIKSKIVFSKVIANYRSTKAADEAYYYIALGYEKLGLNKLAYLKYIYLLKNKHIIDDKLYSNENLLRKNSLQENREGKVISDKLKRMIFHRLARLKILRMNTDEGIHQLLSMLNYSSNKDFRSKVYSELGFTYLKKRNYKKAHRMFDIAHHEDSTNEDAIIGKARALKRLGHHHRAYGIYEYFLKYYGNFSQYTNDVRNSYINQVYSSGYSNYKRGKYNSAISYFKRLLTFYPDIKRSENALYWIGESHLARRKYTIALAYFNKVLSNSYHHRNQDARMKKGYTYFVWKKYDLAAREFQKYMRDYPVGRHQANAKRWKEICTKEILHRINNRSVPKMTYDDDIEEEEREYRKNKKSNNPRGVKSGVPEKEIDNIELENVAEL
ncbi:tetratricopeptide repeat protein [Spirochaetota bacterium]